MHSVRDMARALQEWKQKQERNVEYKDRDEDEGFDDEGLDNEGFDSEDGARGRRRS